MLVYQTDADGFWTGEVVEADLSPLQESAFLIPGGCIATPPPAVGDGECAQWRWEPEGWTIVTIEPVPEPPALIPAISDRQFAQQLAIEQVISEAEALSWAARGELPAALEAAIGELPEVERFNARMLLSAAVSYERQHPLVEQLGAVMGYEPAALDALWHAAALL